MVAKSMCQLVKNIGYGKFNTALLNKSVIQDVNKIKCGVDSEKAKVQTETYHGTTTCDLNDEQRMLRQIGQHFCVKIQAVSMATLRKLRVA